jgi:hypothetical protein
MKGAKEAYNNYKDWRKVPIPDIMKDLPLDSRGYPIPANVLWMEGKPMFAVNDGAEELALYEEGRCSVSGVKLDEGTARMITSPLNALSIPARIADIPIHIDALNYSMKVCPYLCLNRYYKGISDNKAAKFNEKYNDHRFVNTSAADTIPPFMIAVQPGRIRAIDDPERSVVYIVDKIRGMEYYKDGVTIPWDEAFIEFEKYLKVPEIAAKLKKADVTIEWYLDRFMSYVK